MSTTNQKVEEFRQGSISVVKPPLSLSFAKHAQEVIAELPNIPTTSLTVEDIEKLTLGEPASKERAFINELLMSDEGSLTGRNPLSGKFDEHQRKLMEEARTGKKAGGIDMAFLQMLENIERLNIEIAELEIKMDELHGELVSEYGEDFVEDMAQMYLNDEELAKLDGLSPEERDAAILDALKAKMLDGDGNIIPKYAETKIGQYIHSIDQHDKKVSQRDTEVELVEEYIASGGESNLVKSDTMTSAVLETMTKDSSLVGAFTKEAANLTNEEMSLEIALDKQNAASVDSAAETTLSFSGFGQGLT